MGLGEEARSRKAFRDRVNQTADAEALRGMGDREPQFLLTNCEQSETDGTDVE